MSTPTEHLKFQWAELHKIDEQLGMMRHWGVLESDPGFLRLLNVRGAAMGKLGLRLPRITTLVTTLLGLSPGELKLWADAELGWMVEAREKPGAPPVYRSVTDEIARALLKGELTHELEESLMAPVDYYGE